jgi:putative ABC transport system substrate-binding protein
MDRLRAGLRELGYVEGRNLTIEERWADGRYERLPALAAELVRSNVDVIVTHGTPGALAAKHATTTIPIVMAVIGDPVAAGVVASFARPGGNITGQSFFSPEMAAKRIELLKEITPRATRVAYVWNPANVFSEPVTIPMMEAAARSLNVQLERVAVRHPGELAQAFDRMVESGLTAAVIAEDGLLSANYAQVAALAVSRRLLTAGSSEAARQGVTIGYGADNDALFQNAAGFIDKIFKGAKPADMPIQQATRFEFVLNLKTTKALGMDPPTATLLRADEVIE